MKFNLDNFVIDKVKVTTKHFIQCPRCSWKNSLENPVDYCPECSEDLLFSKITEVVDYEMVQHNEHVVLRHR